MVEQTFILLLKLAESLETDKPNLEDPFDERVSELMRLTSTMHYDALVKLYQKIDIGTSYTQETARNLFLEILPRCGSKDTILLTRDLVLEKSIRSTTAVQMLIAMPFNVIEHSLHLVKECEVFLKLGPDRPDVRHAAILSYATLIYKTFISDLMSNEIFEKYIKIYFDRFLNSFEYEEQVRALIYYSIYFKYCNLIFC